MLPVYTYILGIYLHSSDICKITHFWYSYIYISLPLSFAQASDYFPMYINWTDIEVYCIRTFACKAMSSLCICNLSFCRIIIVANFLIHVHDKAEFPIEFTSSVSNVAFTFSGVKHMVNYLDFVSPGNLMN